jgi:hypothetical protein
MWSTDKRRTAVVKPHLALTRKARESKPRYYALLGGNRNGVHFPCPIAARGSYANTSDMNLHLLVSIFSNRGLRIMFC